MKCFKCKGEMRQGYTTFVTDTNESCTVVRHVPCLQCDMCGEVAENLEKIVKATKQAMTEVAVVKYPEAVA